MSTLTLPFARDLPLLIQTSPAAPGYWVRYDDGGEEPVALWGIIEEVDDGERTRSCVALVPEGGELVPAHDASNFEEVFYRGDKVAGHHITPAQCDEARRLIGTVQLWMDRVAVEPEAHLSKADIAAHRGNLTRLAVLLGFLRDAGAAA